MLDTERLITDCFLLNFACCATALFYLTAR